MLKTGSFLLSQLQCVFSCEPRDVLIDKNHFKAEYISAQSTLNGALQAETTLGYLDRLMNEVFARRASQIPSIPCVECPYPVASTLLTHFHQTIHVQASHSSYIERCETQVLVRRLSRPGHTAVQVGQEHSSRC